MASRFARPGRLIVALLSPAFACAATARAEAWKNAFLATGTLSTFPYADKSKALRCSAVHLGQGVVLTAGHCFLGALDCLGAHVVFNGDAHRPFPPKARCQKVLRAHAATFRSGAAAEDFALLLVDTPPGAFVPLADEAPRTGASVRLLSPEGLKGSRNETKGRVPLVCEGVVAAARDPYGRARVGSVFETRCPHSGFSHGAPLLAFDASRPAAAPGPRGTPLAHVVGIVQGSYLPASGGGPVTVFQDVRAAVSSALQAAAEAREPHESSGVDAPSRVTAGSFSSDAFPYGLDGRLDFPLVTLSGAGPHTLAVTQGALTSVEVVDGQGRVSRFEGAPSFASSAPRSYVGPVRVHVRTPVEARSVHAEVVVHRETPTEP